MSEAKKQIKEMREILNMPEKASAWWDGLQDSERKFILKICGFKKLAREYYGRKWSYFNDEAKKEIVSVVRRMSSWAAQMEIV